MKRRTADPYRDLAVIDARAPRFNQAVVGTLSLVAFLVDWWPLYAILAGQFALGLSFGRRWCLPCLLYFEVLQPRLGEGPIEDARPPRFANQVGLVVLGAASIAHVAGAEALGWALGLWSPPSRCCRPRPASAPAASSTSSAPGSVAFAGTRSTGSIVADLGSHAADGLVVQFTHPLCTDCRALEERLLREGRRILTFDVSRRPELARKYGVAVVPTAVDVAADGTVRLRLAP